MESLTLPLTPFHEARQDKHLLFGFAEDFVSSNMAQTDKFGYVILHIH